MSSNSIYYGDVWTDPANRLARILSSSKSVSLALCEALSLGYFSQYTCYTDPTLVARIIDWQVALLSEHYGHFLDLFPADFEEKASVPNATKAKVQGRILTPDLLRNVAYVLQIRSLLNTKVSAAKTRVLEIGSGSGSFARVYKALYPAAQIWMADLPESLRFAEIYLRQSFPAARFLIVKTSADLQDDLAGVDFIFVPLNLKDALVGLEFELALNIWSFGEMPNHFIHTWLDIIQKKCRVKFLFTINAFLAPVTVNSVERANQGDWLLAIDDSWDISYFKVNHEIHRNPFIKNFYCGICLFGQLIGSEAEKKVHVSAAEAGLVNTLSEDWIESLLCKKNDLARAELRSFSDKSILLKIRKLDLSKLLETTEYIGRFNIDEGTSGTMFRLWNAYRMMQLPLAGELLVCYLAMINKSLLEQRCSKEELQILKRLTSSVIVTSYKAFKY